MQRLYRNTSSQLFAVLLRMLKSNGAAEDALQETYIKIWNRADTYNRELGRPITWMTSIARYHALDMLRSGTATRERESNYAFSTGALDVDWHHNPENDWGNTDILNHCLGRIEPEAREMIIGAYCEGYTHSELSRRTDTAIGTVKSWIRRSLISLKECVDELSR